MCGIVGMGGTLYADKIEKVIQQMNAVMVHRGPDDEGTWAEDGFGFGMHRLSIVDLAGGHQPMWDEKTGIGIVYNGEIYNYRDLRNDMEKLGVRFHTTSDTEVVLQSLVLKGAKAVYDWNGMFAVACWNKAERKLILIRDRIGIKPLYYFWAGTTLIFASEIKALLASRLFRPSLNHQAIWDYLTFRYVPGPETVWQCIWKLPPGHILEWSPGLQPKVYSYWKTEVVSGRSELFADQVLREFEDLFLDSVQRHLVTSDVPVGVLLSGGLDSSALAAAAVELGHKRFHTFSVGFDEGGEYSELAYARLMAKHVGAEYHEVIIGQSDFLEMLPESVRAADEPLADLTAVPLLAVSRLARQSVKVVLSGEGSDEILGGYDFDASVRLWNLIKALQAFPPSLLRTLTRFSALFAGSYSGQIAQIAETPLSQWNSFHRAHITKHWSQAEKKVLWPDFLGVDSDRILDDLYALSLSQEPLDQVLSVYQKSWLVENLLMKADKMSMAASVELRVPFLDYRLVEWANRQPINMKVRHIGYGKYLTKYILRRFAEKRIPKEIIQRSKKGFPVPAYRWLKQEKFSRWAEESLVGSKSRLKEVFSMPQLKEVLAMAKNGGEQAAHKTWLLIVLGIWLGEYSADL